MRHYPEDPEGVPASLSPGELDRLADLVVAKLAQKNDGCLPSKQVVAGSSPVSRSTKLGDYLPRQKIKQWADRKIHTMDGPEFGKQISTGV